MRVRVFVFPLAITSSSTLDNYESVPTTGDASPTTHSPYGMKEEYPVSI